MAVRTYNSNFIFLGTNRLPHCNPYLSSNGGWPSSYSSDINGNITFDVKEDEANLELLFENNKILLVGENPNNNESAEYMIQTIADNNNGWITVTASPTNPAELISSPYQSGGRFYFYQSCPVLENYYTNEVIRIRLYTSYVDNYAIPGSITNYSRIKVFGNPLLKISFFTNNGTMLKYAKYSEKYSTGDYFEFHYPIESMDIGQFAIGDYTGYAFPSSDEDIFAYTEESETDYLYLTYEISGTTYEAKYFSNASFSYVGTTRVNEQLVNNFNDGSSIATSRVRINTETTTPLLPGQFTIVLKRSGTPGKIPTKDDLLCGELAMNTVDGKIFAKRADDEIITVGQSVIEYASEGNFPVIGQSDVIYIAADSNKLYRWHEDEYYVQVSSIEPQVFSVGSYTISSTQNNFNISNYPTVRISATSAGLGITGFQAGQEGEMRLIYNGGNYAIDIAHDSTLSSNGNKVLTYDSQTFSLGVNAGVTILYDASYNSNTGAWRLF